MKDILKMKQNVRKFAMRMKGIPNAAYGTFRQIWQQKKRFKNRYCVFQMSLVYLYLNLKSLKIRHFIRLFNSLHYYHITLFSPLLSFGRVFLLLYYSPFYHSAWICYYFARSVCMGSMCKKTYCIGKRDIPNILNKLVFAHKISTPLDEREYWRLQREKGRKNRE